MVRVQVVVQHHPGRAELLPRLLERLDDPIVVTDPGGPVSSAWRCYRECLRADVGDATHIAVLQDDSTVCDFFAEVLSAVVAACPDAAVALFLSPQCRRTCHAATMAMKSRQPWAKWDKSDFWPTVASVYPIAVARAMAAWIHARTPDVRCDDSVCGDYFRAHPGVCAFATVPSLVQHPDDTPSLVGRKFLSGKNPARLAKWWVGEKDPRAISW